jgi:hypothetical protein
LRVVSHVTKTLGLNRIAGEWNVGWQRKSGGHMCGLDPSSSVEQFGSVVNEGRSRHGLVVSLGLGE